MKLAGPRLARAVLPALLCLPAAAQTPAGTSDAEAAVRATFEAYRQALMAGDGEAAASLVDRETGEYYRQLQRLVLEGSEEEVRQRSFVDRFLVVAFRHQFAGDGELSGEEFAAMELADVIVRAMEIGWINSAAIEQLAVGPIRIEGNGRIEGSEAVAAARTRASLEDPSLAGGMDELEYRFVNEDGRWKFRFSALVSSIDGVMRNLAAQLGADEDDLIFTLVESLTGVEVLPEVWESQDR
ncbi:MAG: hypothetical protein OXU63_06390 [Acidobacteriota bacterium]|nr:hypothetical protein [Acidobacteriota bacterium]